ncbi:MAG: sodium:proline symporter, partial [Candidatus Neomarinimicrobiota bacterium]
SGLLGLLLAAFLAAYMSTISTQLNWGSSYIINDFYRRFIRTGAAEKDYVRAARIATVAVKLLSLLVTAKLHRISDAWIFILEASAGIGLVLILRWFWWRINAWSEIAALAVPLLIYPFVKIRFEFPETLFVIVACSTVVWLTVTFLTPPTDGETLRKFYRRVHPGGRLWRPVAEQLPEVVGDSGYLWLLLDWVLGCLLVLSALFGVGHLILGAPGRGVLYLLVAAASAAAIYRHLSRIGWEQVGE